MRPIKICIVSLYAYHLFNPKSESRFGGAEIQLYYLATELAKDPNFEVSFIVGDFGQPEEICQEGVRLYKFVDSKTSVKYLGIILNFIRFKKLFKRINPDFFIQRAAGVETGIIGLCSKLMRKNFFYMAAHNDDVKLEKPEWMSLGFSGSIKWRLFKWGLKEADFVIVQHEAQKKDLKTNYGKVGIIRNSAHLILGEPDINLEKKDAVLWVARCDVWKQPEFFIDAVKSFPKERFVMISPQSGDKSYSKKIMDEAMTLKNLEFIEFVPFNEIDDYFLKAKIFINTSSTEGFPNTFIQAAKNKTPILSLNINPDNMLEKYGIGRCAHGDFEKLKADLNDFLKNHDLWQKTAQNCYDYAKENHDLKKIVEKDKEIILKFFNNETR